MPGNHKPSLRNVDEAIRRRLHLLPFVQTFANESRDIELGEKLMNEAGWILKWMIDGCLEYQKQGLNPPKVVTDATMEYFESENIFAQWLADCCKRGPDLWETPQRLFSSGKRYSENANERTGNQKNLAERRENAGFSKGNSRAKSGRHWVGLRLLPEQQ